MYELGQALLIVIGTGVVLYLLRKPLARLFGQSERRAEEAQTEVTQAYYEGREMPTPKEERIGE